MIVAELRVKGFERQFGRPFPRDVLRGARELLIGLEEGLMDLERRQGDRAHLDKTFRAAHSLKGAAAMVGLAASPSSPTASRRSWSGSARLLAVDSDIITTLLEARDHLAAMVEAEAARSPIPPRPS